MHSEDIQIIINRLEAVYQSGAEFLQGIDAGAFLDEAIEDLKDQKLKAELVENNPAMIGDMRLEQAREEARS